MEKKERGNRNIDLSNVPFQKKDYVYTGNLGVCRVEEITSLSAKDGSTMLYYGLRSMQHETTTAYYPVEGHEVIIRALITEAEALKIKELLADSDDSNNNLKIDKLDTPEILASIAEADIEQVKKVKEDEKLKFEVDFVIKHHESIREKLKNKKKK